MKLKDGFPYASGGIARVLGNQDSNIWQTEEKGITMTSVLFCKHGGLIRAVTSGQETVIAEEETDNEYERNDNSNKVNRYGENILGILTHLREEQ